VLDPFKTNGTSPPEPVYLLVSEAASYLRISTSKLYTMASRGEIEGRKHGGRLVFRRDDLDMYSQSHRIVPRRTHSVDDVLRSNDDVPRSLKTRCRSGLPRNPRRIDDGN